MNGRRRLLCELKNLKKDPPSNFHAAPLNTEDKLFEWHFSVLGPDDTDFEGGIYHGKLVLPSNYPMAPPKIILLTPSGRFKINTRICLSISDFHPETWQPSWGIRTALTALIAFFPTASKGAVGSLEQNSENRKILAQRSEAWKCKCCGACLRDIKRNLVLKCSNKNYENKKCKNIKDVGATVDTPCIKPLLTRLDSTVMTPMSMGSLSNINTPKISTPKILDKTASPEILSNIVETNKEKENEETNENNIEPLIANESVSENEDVDNIENSKDTKTKIVLTQRPESGILNRLILFFGGIIISIFFKKLAVAFVEAL